MVSFDSLADLVQLLDADIEERTNNTEFSGVRVEGNHNILQLVMGAEVLYSTDDNPDEMVEHVLQESLEILYRRIGMMIHLLKS